MKTAYSIETVCAILPMITDKNRRKKNCFDMGTEFAGDIKKLCKAEVIQIYCALSETEATFAERTRRSLKNINYRYIENYGFK